MLHPAPCAALLLLGLRSVAPAAEVHGRLLVAGRPAPGVSVSARPFEDAFARAGREARGEEAESLATAVTGKDGGFALKVPPAAAANDVVLQLAFSGPGCPAFVLGRFVDPAGEDVGDVRLPRAAPLAGRLEDGRGGPVVGATVTLWAGGPGRPGDGLATLEPLPRTTTTRSDGTFRFDAAAEAGNRLRVEAPAFATEERSGLRSGALLRPVTLAVARVLRGRITLPDGRSPAPSAVVRFEGRVATRWFEARRDGSFLVEGVPAGQSGALVADDGERGRGSVPVATDARDPVAIVLAPAAALAGRVVDAATVRPLQGVRLVARWAGSAAFLARSDRNGRYRIVRLPPGRYRLEVDDERFVSWSRPVAITAGRTETQDVPLVRGATLAGRVVGEEGAPIEGALVQVGPAAANPLEAFRRRIEARGGARSGADGSFRLPRLRPGEDLRVEVSHDAYLDRTISGIELASGATRPGLIVVLRRGLAVKGVVKDEEGRPLAGVEVELDRALRVRGGRRGIGMAMIGPGAHVRRETGADGEFEFRGLEAGDFTLTARHPGFARATVDPLRVVEDGSAEPVELVLHPGATISGVVHDRSGEGAAGWLVAARQAGDGAPGFGPAGLRSEQPTGPDGAFLVEGAVPGGVYDLQAVGGVGLGPRVPDVTAPAADVEIRVGGSGQIRGQVVDAESGRPVPDFVVSYRPEARRGMRFFFRTGNDRGPYAPHPFHAEDGSFVLDGVPAGRWQVRVSAEGYQGGAAAGVVVEEGGRAEGVEVRLSRGGTVSGRVLEAQTGRPILDATVEAEQSGRGAGPRYMGQGEGLQATTDAEGRFEITGLAPGTWTLTATHPDWSEATTTFELEGEAASADLRLSSGGSVSGTVLAGGRPVEGAQVSIAASGETGFRGFGGSESALTDPSGRFRFDRLSPGRYELSATLRSQSSAPVEAVVTGETAQEVTLTLAEGATIRGTVSGLPDSALSGVRVSASGPDYFASARVGAGSAFELTGVPEGVVNVTATAGDMLSSFRTARTTVTIGPGRTEAFAEIVFGGGFRVDGRVSRRGEAAPDVVVLAQPEGSGPGASARTDGSGLYVLEGLDEGAYTIVANLQGGTPIRRQVTLSGDTTVDLEVPPARLAGTVIESGSGRPLGDVTVRLEDAGGGGFRFGSMATTDSGGRFSLEDLEPRSYRVSFQKPAYEAETREIEATEDGREVRVELRRGEGLALEARDGIFGTPLRGLLVRVLDAAGAPAFTGSVPLDSDGRGEVPSLKPGSYELRVASAGYAPVVRSGVLAPSTGLVLILTPGGTLEIHAGPRTLALPQPRARLYRPDGSPYLPSVFSTDGAFALGGPVRRLENVAAGRYRLAVDGGESRDVEVREGGAAIVELP
jgi:protocatechuate 3,4-dioxygenase beta subunit/5-hydroxyisourate hydrolase-like protein (transthyretin family)